MIRGFVLGLLTLLALMPKRKLPESLPRIRGSTLLPNDFTPTDSDERSCSVVSATTRRYLESLGANNAAVSSTSSSSRLSGNYESSNTKEGGVRKDLPTVDGARRGNLQTAISAVSDAHLRQSMIDEYLKDKHANSAHTSLASMETTWRRLHHAWFGKESVVFPTSVTAIRAIAASMKFANYRSFDNYASRAKRAHIEAGGVWTQDLELEVKDASRSVNRGIGPPKQSAPLPMDKLIRVGSDIAVHCDHGPIDPVRAITIMCHFVVREIEAAFALAKHWKFDHEAKTITWHLPVSKTDPTAVGCFRSWGCICVPPKTSSLDCPWHTACEYWSQL